MPILDISILLLLLFGQRYNQSYPSQEVYHGFLINYWFYLDPNQHLPSAGVSPQVYVQCAPDMWAAPWAEGGL